MDGEVLFKDINADEEPDTMEIESLCMNCMKSGITRLLLTRIPFFGDVLVTSFACEECGCHNNSVEPAGKIEDHGLRVQIKVVKEADLNRKIVRSKYSIIHIPKLESSFPVSEGNLTTIEGVISEIKKNLEGILNTSSEKEKLIDFVAKLNELLTPEHMPYDLILEDPSGTSQVENFNAPASDPQLTYTFYERSMDENHRIGLYPDENSLSQKISETDKEEPFTSVFDTKSEVMTFDVNCHKCNSPCASNMKVLDIPYFKEIIIMATVCDNCGYRDNEVKGGGGMSAMGKRITLHLTDPKVDMSRDLLKSDTALIKIPELEFETDSGTLGGKFTTVEGILLNIKEQLAKTNPFFFGDSGTSNDDVDNKMKLFVAKIDKIISNEISGVHLILEDPAGNVYIQNPFYPDEDPNLTVEEYERCYDENEMLGLNDMNTENYQ